MLDAWAVKVILLRRVAEGVWRCRECPVSFMDPELLELHVRNCHGGM
jgi:ribosomal protein L37AE/L43A